MNEEAVKRAVERILDVSRNHIVIDLSKKASLDVGAAMKRTADLVNDPLQKGFIAADCAAMMVSGAAAYFVSAFKGKLRPKDAFKLLIQHLEKMAADVSEDAEKSGIMDLVEGFDDLPESLKAIARQIESSGGKIDGIVKITGKR